MKQRCGDVGAQPPSSRTRAPCSRLLHRLPPPQVRAPSTLSCACKSCRFARMQAHVTQAALHVRAISVLERRLQRAQAASPWCGAAVGSPARSCGHATSRVVHKRARSRCQHAALLLVLLTADAQAAACAGTHTCSALARGAAAARRLTCQARHAGEAGVRARALARRRRLRLQPRPTVLAAAAPWCAGRQHPALLALVLCLCWLARPHKLHRAAHYVCKVWY